MLRRSGLLCLSRRCEAERDINGREGGEHGGVLTAVVGVVPAAGCSLMHIIPLPLRSIKVTCTMSSQLCWCRV